MDVWIVFHRWYEEVEVFGVYDSEQEASDAISPLKQSLEGVTTTHGNAYWMEKHTVQTQKPPTT